MDQGSWLPMTYRHGRVMNYYVKCLLVPIVLFASAVGACQRSRPACYRFRI